MTLANSAPQKSLDPDRARKRGTKQAAITPEKPVDAVHDTFRDPFLADWMAGRLGGHEARLILILQVTIIAADERERTALTKPAGHVIGKSDGCFIERQPGEMIGVWGRRHLRADDAERALSAAQEVSALAQAGCVITCLLHAGRADFATQRDPAMAAKLATQAAKREGETDTHPAGFSDAGGDGDDCDLISYDFLIGEASPLARAVQGRAVPVAGILLTEAFKTTCALHAGLLPVSFAGGNGSGNGSGNGGARPYYALTGSGAAGPNFSGKCGPDADLTGACELDGLGDLKPTILAAALAGSNFSGWQLARMMEVEPKRLRPALDAACKFGLLLKTTRRGQDDWFAFRDAKLHATAYGMIPAKDRLRLHRKAAQVLRDAGRPTQRRGLFDGATDVPQGAESAIAGHYRSAQNKFQSKRWLSKAAWKSIADGNVAEAVSQLKTALADADRDTESSALNRGLLQLLGVQLAVTRGNGSDVVLDTYQKSVEFADRTTPPAWGQEFRSLWLAQSCHLVKGEVRAALTIGNLLKTHSQRRAIRRGGQIDSALGQNILIHRMQGLTLLLGGQLVRSAEHYDFVLDHYDFERHAVLRFAYGSDQAALSHAHLSWLHTIAGQSAKARHAARLAKQMCDQLNHAHTTAHVMSVLALAALTAGDHDEALLAAQEARAIAIENGFEYWVPWADVLHAADHARRTPRAGHRMLEAAMQNYQATGAQQLCPFVHLMMAAAALDDGQGKRGLEQANAGIALTKQNGCVLYQPELMRLKARAAFATGDAAGGEAALDISFRAACQSGALLFAQKSARDGMRLARGHAQIEWQARFHQICQKLAS